MVGIYKITNKITGKSYIGQSINVSKRIKEHFWKAKNPKDVSFNSILHQAIRKYGAENFTIEILKECTPEELDESEKYYIQTYHTISPDGYNILTGGQKNRFVPNYCLICHKPLLTKSRYCVECGHKMQQVCERPDRNEFKQMIRQRTFVSIANDYGVSDKAISKWCKAYNLPFRKKDIKKYTDEEWELL